MHKVDNGGDMGEMFHITQKVMISDKIKWRLDKIACGPVGEPTICLGTGII